MIEKLVEIYSALLYAIINSTLPLGWLIVCLSIIFGAPSLYFILRLLKNWKSEIVQSETFRDSINPYLITINKVTYKRIISKTKWRVDVFHYGFNIITRTFDRESDAEMMCTKNIESIKQQKRGSQ